MRALLSFLPLLLASVALSATNDMAVARAALRDGLWEVARTHAARCEDPDAKLIVLETFAREENWKGLLSAIDAMGYPQGAGFTYYRAMALFKVGSVDSSSNMAFGVSFAGGPFASPAARLKAAILHASGDVAGALAVLQKEGGDDVETRLAEASALQQCGQGEAAARIWRVIGADTNASERARATAAVGLQDVALSRQLLEGARSKSVRHFLTLGLGAVLVRDEAHFEEGERMIRNAVRDRPDAPGAKEAHLALADTLLGREKWAEAERTYADALSIWPDVSRLPSLYSGYGRALVKLGRVDEAIAAFGREEELSPDPDRKAAAAVRIADAMALSGRTKEATAVYQRILSAYPDTPSAERVAKVVRFRAQEERGRALYDEFKFTEARAVFAELAKEESTGRDVLAFYCALCAYGAGNEESAEGEMRKLAETAADADVRARATLWLAKLSFNRRRWREAEGLFKSFVTMSPNAPDAPQALVWSARASLAGNDFQTVVTTVARLVADYPKSSARASGMLAQGEALIELGRFDEAVLVLDRASLLPEASDADRLSARIVRADALFAMGADNPTRYAAALDAYRAIQTGESLSPATEIAVAFKIARTLEKLRRMDEAVDMYYTQVVLAYRTGRLAGMRYDDATRATFSRAALRLADELESRGRIRQAIHVLDLVRASDVPAAEEASRRIEGLTRKGLLP